MTSPAQPLVAPDFVVPPPPATDRFRLEPLGPQHNAADHAAWTSSIAHIRANPDFAGRSWPPVAGMSLEANLEDLRRHAEDFERRSGFTYTVLSVPGNDVIGCVYIYGSRQDPEVTDVRSWVRASHASLDTDLYRVVSDWVEREWPFGRVAYTPR
ncbi:twin-arginine translocation pathway signal protein [Streptomyces griseofuscus]|uniref:Twin-arginine translocation pathway signal protein n=1 Tax=Streptomyces griseofuscus TaxID=146922 RepID=A0A3R8SGM7_9ACTN|nr:N-acetyltransferase [Streptomyces griseofuscus]RRQ76408.1 twin-arginine translocation pathway signal protein [Streptomyces griseofuscus]RRQ88727.1 twin-arginine translocation pathway signal protein [Streptomyces griseofuscus]